LNQSISNVTLIYCGVGNIPLDIIAINNGFKYGLRLPIKKRLDVDLYFADQDWKNPNKEKYIEYINLYKPKLATVIDIEQVEQLDEAIEWAMSISNVVDQVILIPKCLGIIENIPYKINKKEVILGFSVPTKYGATTLSPKLFEKRKVHLLGGSPHKQLSYLDKFDIVSVDCNYHSMLANKFGIYWTGKINGETKMSMHYDDNFISPTERSLKAFEISCKNIMYAWKNKLKYD